jgi:hypothetical protein
LVVPVPAGEWPLIPINDITGFLPYPSTVPASHRKELFSSGFRRNAEMGLRTSTGTAMNTVIFQSSALRMDPVTGAFDVHERDCGPWGGLAKPGLKRGLNQFSVEPSSTN